MDPIQQSDADFVLAVYDDCTCDFWQRARQHVVHSEPCNPRIPALIFADAPSGLTDVKDVVLELKTLSQLFDVGICM
jgi:hypothetical protein